MQVCEKRSLTVDAIVLMPGGLGRLLGLRIALRLIRTVDDRPRQQRVSISKHGQMLNDGNKTARGQEGGSN